MTRRACISMGPGDCYNVMMSDHQLTPGAQRVLAEVQRRIQKEPSLESPFATLLMALLEDEGHAAELLREVGLEPGRFESVSQAGEFPAEEFREWRRVLVLRADRFAIGQFEQESTGTEHLLLAAIELDPGVAALLAERGLSREELFARFQPHHPGLSGPDESLAPLRAAGQGSLDESSLFRILDASANRCREGLRVVEDFVRFDLDDELLSRELKELRHLLTNTLIGLGQGRWIPCRDTEHDVGTRGQLASERFRGSLLDVVRAGCKRVEEALRSLEEYGKLLDAELSERLTGCRYRFYTVEKGIEAIHRGRDRLQNCFLYLLVTDAHCRYGAETTIRNAVTAGVDIVQVREKTWSDRQLVDFCRKVRDWTAEAGALLIINDRPDIAAVVGADGVHLGQDDLSVVEARKVLGARGLIGVSTHRIEDVREALFSGADYLGVGPVFPSRTKPFESFPGLEYVRQVSANTVIPWFAIGGITRENIAEVRAAGATRVAVSSAICAAAHPRGVARELREACVRIPGESSAT